MSQDISVDLEFTPNPNSLKYVTTPDIMDKGAYNFATVESAKGNSKLAEKLFEIEGIVGVMVAKSFVSITLENHERLTEINDEVIDTIKTFVSSGEKPVSENMVNAPSAVGASEAEKIIISVLDDEIRPAVAMDGGDITFNRYEDGILFLEMKGACSGCPSSTATLKLGIENKLKEKIPDLLEVVAI